VTTEALEAMKEVACRLNEASHDQVLRLVGPYKAAAIKRDADSEKSRRVALRGDEEFFFKEAAILGELDSNKLLLRFEPVDAADYDFIELKDNEVLKTIDGAEAWFERLLGTSLGEAKKAAKKVVRERLEQERKAAEEAKRQEEEARKAGYVDMPVWGSF
jgi:hypothetical protein